MSHVMRTRDKLKSLLDSRASVDCAQKRIAQVKAALESLIVILNIFSCWSGPTCLTPSLGSNCIMLRLRKILS